MKTFSLEKLFIILFSFVSFSLLPASVANAGGPTYIKGVISTNTIWTQTNSPYIVAPTVVESGVTLIIEPGVEVKFAEDGKLTVEGKLQAIGTASNKIKFTTDLKTSWRGISVSSGTLQYGEITNIVAGFTNAQISNSDFSQSYGFSFSNTTVSNSNFSQSDRISSSSTTITDSNFTRNKEFRFSNSTISRSRFYNNARTSDRFDLIPHMIVISGASTFDHNAVFGNLSAYSGYLGTPTAGYPLIYLEPDSSSGNSPKLTHNLIYGNPSGGISSTGATNIQYNNIYNNNIRDLGFSLDRGIPTITNNWWGATDTSIIEQHIGGLFDEYGRKKLEYLPVLTSPDPEAPTVSVPSISSISPDNGANNTTTNIIITGTNFKTPQTFEAPLSVTIGSISAANVNFVSTTSITATIPSGIAADTYDVTVTNPDGLSATLPKAFKAISVLPTGEIYGRVVNQAGQSIPNVTIKAGDIVVSPNSSTGEFRISNIPTGIYTVYYDTPSYVSQTQKVIPVFEGKITTVPTVVMFPPLPTGRIKGRITDASGRPILGTPVRINNIRMATAITGEFEFTLVADGIYTIYYNAPGHISQTQVVEVKAGATTSPPTVIMSHLGEIFGKVINGGTRRPFRGATVRVNNVVIPTNRRGEFRFTLVYPGIYTIHYDALGYRGQIQEYVAVYPDRRTVSPTCILFP